jgi:DNA replication protein DnaC
MKNLMFSAQVPVNPLDLPSKNRFVELVSCLGGEKLLDNPTLESEICCPCCGKIEHFVWPLHPVFDNRQVWICADTECSIYNKENLKRQSGIARDKEPPKRALEWPEFCEINEIGDLHHGLRFENISQSKESLCLIRDFVVKPRSTMLMMGPPGTGKTFAAMGACEYFTRQSSDCFFFTQNGFMRKFDQNSKLHERRLLESKWERCALIVVDDFGLGSLSEGFKKFLMDLIQSRREYSSRGTILTTNLSETQISDVVGSALTDRLINGLCLPLDSRSRRKNQFT